ncbi:hypothetical protein [Streptomyces sp. NBC_01176]|uniref:hypothetical protein n=1 Tax=Streptomyces sp. NBC_01176 TaxID=2903760 RepID=UPI002F90C1D4|nr:hypothetical protein OG199_43680 [Streptomyces sp. NBC_01176]
METSDHVLRLVRKALDEFDDTPLEVAVRRAVRIANLVGDTKYAVRLSLDLKTMGGDRETNGEISRMLMEDPSTWGSMTGPAEQALKAWMNDRKIEGSDNIDSHSLAELEFWDNQLGDLKESGERVDYETDLNTRQRTTRILARTRHLTFALLCSWERRLDYSTINESIFDGYRVKVDALLGDGVPDLLQQFSAVYRRLQEAADSAPDRDVTEELSQAITTCRRILKAVVDHVFPARDEPSADGLVLDDSKHRNRLSVFIKQTVSSDSDRALIDAIVAGLYERFTAIDKMTNKAVHAKVAIEIANLCALNTYIVCGETISLHALASEQQSEPTPAGGAAAGDTETAVR